MKSFKHDRQRCATKNQNLRRKLANRRKSRGATFETLEARRLLAFSAVGPEHPWLLAGGAESAAKADWVAEGEPPSQVSYYLPRSTDIWPTNGFQTPPSLSAPRAIAFSYLRNNAAKFGLTSRDFDNAVVTNEYVTEHTGTTHIYLQQTYNGLPVVNGLANVNVSDSGQVINASVSFVPGLGGPPDPSSVQPTVTAAQAYAQLASAIGLSVTGQVDVVSMIGGPSQKQVISSGRTAPESIPAELSYVPTPNGVQLSWQLDVELLENGNWYRSNVSAENGQVLGVTDLVFKLGTYNVFPQPVDSPQEGTRSILVDPQDPVASPFGWHDVNGLQGADFLDTRGNNVFAQEDRAGLVYNRNPLTQGSVALGYRPSGGSGLNFNFPLDLTQNPINYQDAAITNLFYWMNLAHDVYSRYGFDEVAGNFQMMNYTGRGLANDPIHAFAQAPGGPFFFPTPDGTSPIIAMTENTFIVTTNPIRDADLQSSIMVHEFTHGLSTRLTGGPANFLSLQALQSRGLGEGWSDFLALMFKQKPTYNKQSAIPEGTWFLGQPANGPGVRIYPYSYDMSIDPATYGIYNVNPADFYDDGLAWASALWDANLLLMDKYGYDANLATGTGGNNLIMQLVIDAMKLQPALPTYMDARNAILTADTLMNQGVNHKELWQAFSRRGFGFSATDGGNANATLITESFDMPRNPGFIRGAVWSDDNGNGVRDVNEAGIGGWTVFLDLDRDGKLNAFEPTTKTDGAGNYSFELYVPGTFNVVPVIDPSFALTAPPPPGSRTVNVASGQSVTGVDFGARPGALQSGGLKYHDINGNGTRDANEPGISGIWIYVDYDGDGRADLGEPKAVTDIYGRYQLAVDRPGTYYVREIVPPGWTQTKPGGKELGLPVTVSSGSLNVNIEFANTRSEDWSDAPASYGTLAADGGAMHPILPGLFLGSSVDAESDGVPTTDARGDDLSTVTNDEDGVIISSLIPGQKPTVTVTVATGSNPIGALHGWIDVNRNGVFDANEKFFSNLLLGAGTHTITGDKVIPAIGSGTSPGDTYARFRYGYTRDLGPTGPDVAGEVEDYRARILGDRPDARDDSFAVPQNSAKQILDVLLNDVSSVNGPIQISKVTLLSGAVKTLAPSLDKLFVEFEPFPGYVGTVTFEYEIKDKAGLTDRALVTVAVTAPNPVAVDDFFNVNEGSSANIFNVLQNDSTGQNPPLQIVQIIAAPNVNATLDDRGTSDPTDDVIRYTPPAGTGVTEQFKYVVQDSKGQRSNEATVTVQVLPGAFTGDVVRYVVVPTDLNGIPISKIPLGSSFYLNVDVQDLRTNDGEGNPTDRLGVSGAYLDVLFDAARVTPTGNIIHSSTYSELTSGNIPQPGLIDEAGGFQLLRPPGSNLLRLISVPMKATAEGVVELKADPADRVTTNSVPDIHDTVLFEPTRVVRLHEIRFEGASLTIYTGQVPLATDDTFSVAEGSSNNPLTVLTNDQTEAANLPLQISSVQPLNNALGTITTSFDKTQLIYTPPTTTFQGTEQFQYKIKNKSDVESEWATVTIQVGSLGARNVSYRLATTDLSGNPISSINRGGQFQLRVYVKDNRTTAPPPKPASTGLFAAYLDVLYNSTNVKTVKDATNKFGFQATIGGLFPNSQSASDALPNLVDEVGGFQNIAPTTGTTERLLATIAFTAEVAGQRVNFVADPADVPLKHDTLFIFPDNSPVPLSQINYGSTFIDIASASAEGEHNRAMPQDVNNDHRVTPIDALMVINRLNRSESGEGEAPAATKVFADVNNDGHITPIDALLVINRLNSQESAEGEAEGESTAVPAFAATGTGTLVRQFSQAAASFSAGLPSTPQSVLAIVPPGSPAQQAAQANDDVLAQWSPRDRDETPISDDLADAVLRGWNDPLSSV